MSVTLQPIFNLGDRGLIALPANVGIARDALARLDAVEMAVSRHPLDVAAELVEMTVAAAHADTLAEVDFSTPIRAAEDAQANEHRIRAIVGAREFVAGQVDAAVRSNAEKIVKLLQPRFAALVIDLREGLKTAAAWPDPAQALSAPAKIRTHLAAVHTARHAIDEIIAARAVLSQLGYRSSVDEAGEFALCRNFDVLWPRQGRQISPIPPWGDGDWITYWLTHRGEVWLPTVQEQDDRFNAVYGELITQHTNRVRTGRALASMISGGDRTSGPTPPRRETADAGPTTTEAAHHRLFGTPVPTAEPVPTT